MSDLVPRRNWEWHHWFAVALCLAVFVASGSIALLVFEQVPHLEDEVAYLFQAQVFAAGRAYVPAPFHSNCFFAPFVLDYEGRRFGKYPPGWPALLGLGVRMGQLWWVNAAFAAVIVALIFRIGRDTRGALVGATAASLAATSPFLLILSGSLMSHTSCLAFVTAFLWCYRRSLSDPRRGWALAAGVMLGSAFTIRPYTAVAMAILAAAYALWRMLRHRERERMWLLGLGFILMAPLVLVANAVWTGDPFLSPYVLFWPYDRPGFGPGHGWLEGGNTVWSGLGSAVISVGHLATHLHGWPALSLVFVVVLFLYKPRRLWDLFLAGTCMSLILAYVAYWTNGDVFGPRYIAETLSALFLLSAAGIVRSLGRVQGRRRGALVVVLMALVIVDLAGYLPQQLRQYHGLYGITAESRRILQSADLEHALVIVQEERGWWDYAVAFSMNRPTLDGEVVYASDCSLLNEELVSHFPTRNVYYFDGKELRLHESSDGG